MLVSKPLGHLVSVSLFLNYFSIASSMKCMMIPLPFSIFFRCSNQQRIGFSLLDSWPDHCYYNFDFEQMSARGSVISTRNNQLLKSIHNLQREQIKSQKRVNLVNTINPPAEVYRLKQMLPHFNIQYFPQEIAEVTYHPSLDSQLPQEIHT